MASVRMNSATSLEKSAYSGAGPSPNRCRPLASSERTDGECEQPPEDLKAESSRQSSATFALSGETSVLAVTSRSRGGLEFDGRLSLSEVRVGST